MNQVMVVSAARTPLGAFCGQLESLSEQQLAAAAMLEAVRRAGIEPEKIDEVIVGTAKQTSKPSNCGRHAMLLARLPEKIPAYTVQRQSASGLQAVANGYWAIRCGDAGAVLAGGTESMSQIPFEIRHARYAFTGNERAIIDAIPAQETGAQPVEKYGILTAAERAEHFCRRYCFSESELEAFAEASLRKARSAAEGGLFGEELFPVTVKKGKKEESIDRDELLKQAALLAPPADGAAMCLLASPQRAKELGLPVLAEILSVGDRGGGPPVRGDGRGEGGPAGGRAGRSDAQGGGSHRAQRDVRGRVSRHPEGMGVPGNRTGSAGREGESVGRRPGRGKSLGRRGGGAADEGRPRAPPPERPDRHGAPSRPRAARGWPWL